MGMKRVALKLGPLGSALLYDGEILFCAPVPVQAIDATGAGTALTQVFCLRGFAETIRKGALKLARFAERCPPGDWGNRGVPHRSGTGCTEMSSKVCIIGGGGVRTPLLIHGLLQAQQVLKTSELVLYDVSHERAEFMAALGREIAGQARRRNSIEHHDFAGICSGRQLLCSKQRARRRHGGARAG